MTALLASRSAAHFAVDLACGFVCLGVFVPGAASLEEAALGVFLYNLLAFATQPLLGAVCDRFPRRPWATLGCLTVAAGALLGWLSLGWGAVVLCGLGNALFHPGGGRDALVSSPGTLWQGGVFVSTGALGVALGMFWGAAFPRPWMAAALAALLGLCALFCWKTPLSQPERRAAIPGASSLPFWWVVGLALGSVALRAFVGGAVPLPWKTGLWALAAAAAAFLGKAAGGFLADRVSPRLAGVGALLLSLPLLCLGWAHPPAQLAGAFVLQHDHARDPGGRDGQAAQRPGAGLRADGPVPLCGDVAPPGAGPGTGGGPGPVGGGDRALRGVRGPVHPGPEGKSSVKPRPLAAEAADL